MSKLRGEQFCRRGGGKPDRALGAHSWATGNPCTRDWARFSSLRFSLLVKHSCPEWLGPRSGVSEERKVKKFNQNGMHAKLLAQQTNKSKKLKARPRLWPGRNSAFISFSPKLLLWKLPPLNDVTQICFILYFHFMQVFPCSSSLFPLILPQQEGMKIHAYWSPSMLMPPHPPLEKRKRINKKTLQK